MRTAIGVSTEEEDVRAGALAFFVRFDCAPYSESSRRRSSVAQRVPFVLTPTNSAGTGQARIDVAARTATEGMREMGPSVLARSRR